MVHIDQGAITAISDFFKTQIPENAEVLDLMSSWRSHWPADHPKEKMVGLGLNQVELKENPDLDEFIVHNLNKLQVIMLKLLDTFKSLT